MPDIHDLFLLESFLESREMYEDAIRSERASFWDHIVVTTASARQARVYEALLQKRVEEGYLPAGCRYTVLPDRGDKRIGSGGATLDALALLHREAGGDMARLLSQKSLIIHSGGDAQRMPHSAPLGKLFALSGTSIGGKIENPPAAIFDDLMVSLAGLPSRMKGGVVVVSGDAFFRFNHTQLDLDTSDIVVLAMKAPVEEGTVHGVFLADAQDRVRRFLHKQPQNQLRAAGAVTPSGSVDLDIAVAFLGGNVVRALLELVLPEDGGADEPLLERYVNDRVRLSFYGDILYALAEESTLDSLLAQVPEGEDTPELRWARERVFGKLHGIPMYVQRLSPGAIWNMGTTEEAILKLHAGAPALEPTDLRSDASGVALLNDIAPGASVGAECFLENSCLEAGAIVGDRCLVSGCVLPSGTVVPGGMALHCVPLVGGRWVCRVWSAQDDIKGLDTWCGRIFNVETLKISCKSLWDAPLFPVCKTAAEALEWALLLCRGALSSDEMVHWAACPRVALADVSDMDDVLLCALRDQQEDRVRMDSFATKLFGGVPIGEALAVLGTGRGAQRRVRLLATALEEGAWPAWQDAMRLYLGLAEAVDLLKLEEDADLLRARGFEVLRLASVRHMSAEGEAARSVRWCEDVVEVSAPVRANWGGTWSDAPPYCFEHGGTMLNAAVLMDGRYPIRARVERIEPLVVEFVSVDANASCRYEDLAPLLVCDDPFDYFILFKAALVVSGALSREGGSLCEQLRRAGGGLRITTQVEVPRGSGLGTSSIITGTLIDALTKMLGHPRGSDRLSGDVLLAEQMMTTGGGWQDAIGGMYPGIKLTFTRPGIPQVFDIQTQTLPQETMAALNRRGFLLYTGQRRLARSVLRRVLSNYVCNKPASLQALSETRNLAVVMAHELRRDDVSSFGALLSTHMRLLREMDASSSNLMLDHILQEISGAVEGSTLCGAAGGGFIYGILRDGTAFEDLKQLVARRFEGTHIRLYTATIV